MKQIIKVHNGVPENLIDEHSNLYLSFNGTSLGMNNEIDVIKPIVDNATTYHKSPMGLGLYVNGNNVTQYPLKVKDIICIDFYIEPKGSILTKTAGIKDVIKCLNSNNESIFTLSRSNTTNGWSGFLNNGEVDRRYFNIFGATTFDCQKLSHIRFIIDTINNEMLYYENGEAIEVQGLTYGSKPIYLTKEKINSIAKINIGADNHTGQYVISDLHISSINRGKFFFNLPNNLNEIQPKFGQQQIKSDVTTSQKTIDIVSIGKLYPHIVCSRQSGNWASGDTITIKGLSDEIINGNNSNPIVTTTDGTTISGTWSGLGTKQAKFTLSTNSNITNKDLSITYYLNIPKGNSNFSEIPKNINYVYNQVGEKLSPVNIITIIDDLKNRTLGNVQRKNHYLSFRADTSYLLPSNFTKDSYIQYTLMEELNELYASLSNTSGKNNISQVLVHFNIIDMVEKKLGSTIPGDKIEWLKNNIDSLRLLVYGCGSGVGGNNLSCKVVQHSNGTLSSTPWKTTSGDIEVLPCSVTSSSIASVLSKSGEVDFVLYTNPTDTVTPSIIWLDYVCMEVHLKCSSDYEVFYTPNNLKVDEGVCNPMLINRYSKTAFHLLPTKEHSTIQYTYSEIPELGKTAPACSLLSKGEVFISNLGTASVQTTTDTDKLFLGQLLNKKRLSKYDGYDIIKVPRHLLTNKNSNKEYSHYLTQLEGISVYMTNKETSYILCNKSAEGIGYTSSQGVSRKLDLSSILPPESSISSFYGIAFYLVAYKGEMLLLVVTSEDASFDLNYNSKSISEIYKIKNRPLIK